MQPRHNPEVPVGMPEPTITVKFSDIPFDQVKKWLEANDYLVEHTSSDGNVSEYLNQRGYAVINGDEDEVALWLMERHWLVSKPEEQEPITIAFTGSIQDAELAEAITDAYAKHGPRLAELIRNL